MAKSNFNFKSFLLGLVLAISLIALTAAATSRLGRFQVSACPTTGAFIIDTETGQLWRAVTVNKKPKWLNYGSYEDSVLNPPEEPAKPAETTADPVAEPEPVDPKD